MKKTSAVSAAKAALAVRAGKAVLEKLPIEEKKLKLAAALLDKTNLKRLGFVAVSGAAALSLGGTVLQTRLTRAALRKELKRQLEPLHEEIAALQKSVDELNAKRNAAETTAE